jgi:hypothetical protein
MLMPRLLFARIEAWVVLALLLVGMLGVILFGAVLLEEERGNHRFGAAGTAAKTMAEIPRTVEALLQAEDRMVVYREVRFDDPPGWSFPETATGTGLSGYWLMSRFDPAERRSIIEMVRLSDAKVMHVWRPDPDSLLADARRTSQVAHVGNWTTGTFRYFAPYLMPGGDLIVKDSASPLVRIDACARKVWMQDQTTFHHSTEADGTGGFWIPSHIEPSQIPHVTPTFADDALAHVAADGTILDEISVAGILMRHGLQHIVFQPQVTNDDPLHLNDIEPVLTDGPYWKKGDLFLSLRHPAMVMLYRPSTDEILWMKQGPWMAQHDVDILDDHRISVFDNRAYFRGEFGRVDGTSDIAVYDYPTDAVSRPHHDALAAENTKVLFEGLYTRLPEGAYVLEDQTAGVVLVFAEDGRKLAQFVNRPDDGKVYQIGWGRYVDQQTGDHVLQQIERIDCNA